MGELKLSQNDSADFTVVSNVFIDKYMKDANDAQIKIYLYLLRMMSAKLPTDISDIADKFNHTEKDVLRALKYWEKNKLLNLEYDDLKNLTGVRFVSLTQSNLEKASVSTPAEIIPLTAQVTVSPTVAPAVASVSSGSTPNTANTPAPVVPLGSSTVTYTLDQLRNFKKQEETAQLLFIVEQYIGKPLAANDIRSIFFMTDKLGFSVDLIDYLVQYCVGRDKRDFRYIEKVAISWSEAKVTTPKQAATYAKKYDKAVYTIMKDLGKSSQPTDLEAGYIRRWTKDYAFTSDIISEACRRTVLATDKHRFEYAESILASWFKSSVHSLSDITAMDESFQHRKVIAKTSGSENHFNQFEQHDYDFSALEKSILSN